MSETFGACDVPTIVIVVGGGEDDYEAVGVCEGGVFGLLVVACASTRAAMEG